MAKGRFAAQVEAWVRKAERRTEYVIKESAQRLFVIAQTPGPSVANPDASKGGLLPVDTGFHRSSFSARIGQMPSGPSRPEDGQPADWAAPVTLVIAGMRPGDVLFAGWSSAYARKLEEEYGFMKTAASKWQSIVDEVSREARERVQ